MRRHQQKMEHEEGHSLQEIELDEAYSVQAELELLQIHVVGCAAVWEEDYIYTQRSAHQYH